MVLVDASVWVAAGANRDRLREYVGEQEVAVCPPVVQEILRGASNEANFLLARDMFRNLTIILDAPMPLERYEEAARLYMHCRDKGVTIRKDPDSLIAACALRYGLPLYHRDRDFQHIARVTSLEAIRV